MRDFYFLFCLIQVASKIYWQKSKHRGLMMAKYDIDNTLMYKR